MKRRLPFLKTLPETFKHIKETKFCFSDCSSINLYACDESRFGLLSIPRRCLTAKGIKPVLPYQHRFQNCYLFGAYSPVNGDSLTLEMPYCNTECFQIFLDTLSEQQPEEFKILLLDNGAFHHSQSLNIPENIHLLFIPPYSPELNPAEQIWRYIKDKMANIVFDSMQTLSDNLCDVIQALNKNIIQSIVGWKLYNKCIR